MGDEDAEVEVLVLVLVLEVVGVEVGDVVVRMMSGMRGLVVVTSAGCVTVVDDLVGVLVSGVASEGRAGKKYWRIMSVDTDGQEW